MRRLGADRHARREPRHHRRAGSGGVFGGRRRSGDAEARRNPVHRPSGQSGGSAESGLIPYLDWLKARPAEAQALSPFPGYKEPDYTVTLNGVSKPRHETLKVYVAEGPVRGGASGRVDRSQGPGQSRLHPGHGPGDQAPRDRPRRRDADQRPGRRLRPAARHALVRGAAACIESRYDLEGKLPLGVRLANKLEEGSAKKIAEFVSSFRASCACSIRRRRPHSRRSRKVDTPSAGGLEQTIFWVNQILRFGKFLAVFQSMPNDPQKTVVPPTSPWRSRATCSTARPNMRACRF